MSSEAKEKYLLFDNLFNLFFDMKYQKEDEDDLKDNSIDIDDIVEKNMMLFRQLKTQTKAELNQAKHDRVLAFLLKVKTGIESNVEEYKKIAEEIFSKP